MVHVNFAAIYGVVFMRFVSVCYALGMLEQCFWGCKSNALGMQEQCFEDARVML